MKTITIKKINVKQLAQYCNYCDTTHSVHPVKYDPQDEVPTLDLCDRCEADHQRAIAAMKRKHATRVLLMRNAINGILRAFTHI